MKVYINQEHCIACGLCREVTPDACTGEATCLEYCPVPEALVQYEVATPSGR